MYECKNILPPNLCLKHHLLSLDIVDGEWSNWSKWGTVCSNRCGKGVVKRTRTCDSPAPINAGQSCQGPAVQKKSCTSSECPGKSHIKWQCHFKITLLKALNCNNIYFILYICLSCFRNGWILGCLVIVVFLQSPMLPTSEQDLHGSCTSKTQWSILHRK